MHYFLDKRHSTERDFVQRLTNKQWKQVLLRNEDCVIFKGECYRLIGNPIGFGLVDVYKYIPEEPKKNSYDPYEYDIEEIQEWHYYD